MLSDEEKYAINTLEYVNRWRTNEDKYTLKALEAIDTVLNLIEKQQKEIEELKEDRKKYAEEYIHNNPWLYKQLNENYILIVESEQKERKAYIKGTNDAHELCNKKWEDKIKAKIEEINKEMLNEENSLELFYRKKYCKEVLQSLLEKE